jgi:hypothetical protein
MAQMQNCYVCGYDFPLAQTRIQINVLRPVQVRLAGQCPVCHRFICQDHAEKLDPNLPQYAHLRTGTQLPGIVVLGCPFDPGTPLGPLSSALPSPLEMLNESA